MRRGCPTVCAIAALALVCAGPAAAFHDGGVASCSGCHIMHQSEDGTMVVADGALLRASSGTDLCLSCHARSLGAVLGDDAIAPPAERGAGNFVFLTEDNISDAGAGPREIVSGDRGGHSIVSPERGLVADTFNSVAPGGSYPASQLGCTSCHDPHGNGNFRMLWGAGPIGDGSFTFTSPAPEADAPPLGGAAESPTNHVAYRSGWSNWCGNCHGTYHQGAGSSAGFVHPVDRALSLGPASSYNQYRGEADPRGGSQASSYQPQVPFEDASTTVSSAAGPASSSRIACITCHRAHATSAPAATRWDTGVLHLDDDGNLSGSYPIPNPFPGPDQRSLCITCHVDETRSHGLDTPCMVCHGQGGNR